MSCFYHQGRTTREPRGHAMRGRKWAWPLILALLTVPAAAQDGKQAGQKQPADEGQPATTNVTGAAYPRIHPDLRVTFRVKAPGARKVQVQGGDGLGKGPFEMVRGEDGFWTVTTPPT